MQYDNLGPKNFKKPSPGEEKFFDDKNTYGEEERWWWIFQNPLGVMIMIAIAIVLIIGLWFVFHSSKPSDNQQGVMIIKAENASYKEEASDSANPGVENQDKEVYKRLGQQNTEEQTTIESVAIEEEKPLETHEFPEAPSTTEEKKSLDQPQSLRKITENVGVKMPSPAVNEKFIAEKSDAEESSLSEEPQTSKKAVEKKNPEKTKVPTGLTAGAYTLRIASFRKMETADRELQRVFDTLGSALKGVGRLVKRIESDSGVFYVVTIGAFSTLAKAKQISNLLKQKNFDAVIQKVSG